MAEITDPNYETVSATCENCEAENVFSRIDDLGDVTPVSGRGVVCVKCGEQFWIHGDRINTAYEFLIDDAKDHFARKRYMPAIASLGQAWEVFFAACAISTYVYAPFFSKTNVDEDIDELNEAYREVNHEIGTFTWFPLRNLLLNMLLSEHRPQSMAETATYIAQLSSFGNEPSPKRLAAEANARKREIIAAVQALTVGKLRNNVVHKYAYRPKRSEVEPCLTSEVSTLYRVKHYLGVGDFMEHQFDAVYKDA